MNLPATLVLLLAAAAQERDLDDAKSFPVRIPGTHYEIRATTDPKLAHDLLQHMELVYFTYTKLLALARPPAQKMVLVLFRDFKEYQAAGSPGDSVAYYDGKHLVGYWDEKRTQNYFAHEGFHQFTDKGLKAIDKAGMWFIEGMAECIGNSVVREKKLYMCVKDGRIAFENIGHIRYLVRKKKHVPIDKLLRMPHQEFMNTSGMYPEAWSFCHFLMAYPAYEEPDKQIPNGKYWKVLSRYIQLMSKPGTESGNAIRLAFVNEKGKPLDLGEIEKEWMDYVLQWPIKGMHEEDEDVEPPPPEKPSEPGK